MKRQTTLAKRAWPVFVICAMLLAWSEAGEAVGPYTETKITAADGRGTDDFGHAVAIWQTTAVIGAVSDNDLGRSSGSAYVFERNPTDLTLWHQIAKLTASDGAELDSFGDSVAIAGNTVVIGATHSGDVGEGAAYVFERDPVDRTAWTEIAKLTASDGGVSDFLGGSVAISGDTIVVGAIGVGMSALHGTGSAYTFERDPVDPHLWTQTAKLTASDADALDYFGASVSIAGNTVVIGALYNDSGAAYVFERDLIDPRVWTETAKLTASDGLAYDRFGASVEISEDTALIAAPGHPAVYVFERDLVDPTVWTETAKLTGSDDPDLFGDSVAMSDPLAVIGAPADDDLGVSSGSAYVFERDPVDRTAWTQTAKLTASDGTDRDFFGGSVAISGDTTVIGASEDDNPREDSGSAYIYAPLSCELELALEPAALRPGEDLRVAIDLHHRRPVVVTVPVRVWIEDAAGHVVVEKRSQPITLEPGDHRQLRWALTVPQHLPPGAYRALVALDRMQQGIARDGQAFRVVE